MPRRERRGASGVPVRGPPVPVPSRRRKYQAGPLTRQFAPSIRPAQRRESPPAVSSDPQKRRAGCEDRQAPVHALRELREWPPTPRACGEFPLLRVSAAGRSYLTSLNTPHVTAGMPPRTSSGHKEVRRAANPLKLQRPRISPVKPQPRQTQVTLTTLATVHRVAHGRIVFNRTLMPFSTPGSHHGQAAPCRLQVFRCQSSFLGDLREKPWAYFFAVVERKGVVGPPGLLEPAVRTILPGDTPSFA